MQYHNFVSFKLSNYIYNVCKIKTNATVLNYHDNCFGFSNFFFFIQPLINNINTFSFKTSYTIVFAHKIIFLAQRSEMISLKLINIDSLKVFMEEHT